MLLVACKLNTSNTILRTVVTVVQIHINKHLHLLVPAISVDVTHAELLQQLIVSHAVLLQQLLVSHEDFLQYLQWTQVVGVVMVVNESGRPVLGSNYRQTEDGSRQTQVWRRFRDFNNYNKSRHQLLLVIQNKM